MRTNYPLFFLLALSLISCDTDAVSYQIELTNEQQKRFAETIEISLKELTGFSEEQYANLIVTDENNNEVRSQVIDLDQDSIHDKIIFQTDLAANETKTFGLVRGNETRVEIENSISTFCRIVPERIDDFAWENDKVAFRTYGPKCQQLFEQGNPAGLISSGIDCWLKRVNYPIVDKWYANAEKGKSYHVDYGEGLDNYHVGTTRGCGGTAVVCEGNTVISENFRNWKVIANGPIRSMFKLEYNAIDACENSIVEKKIISIDLGSNLYHCQVLYYSELPVKEASASIAIHQGRGVVKLDKEKGWIAYWEPLDDSYLGTAIMVDSKRASSYITSTELNENESLNNIGVNLNVVKNSFSYWAGFGWKKADEFSNFGDWTTYLNQECDKRKNPISITIRKN